MNASKRALRLLALGALLPLASAARAAGTSGADFLQVDVAARGTGLGGAFSSVVDDAWALFWNPAGLAAVKRGSFGAAHNEYLAGIRSEAVAAAYRTDPDLVVAGAIHHWDFGAIKGTDVSGNSTGEFSPRATVLAVGAGRSIADMSDRDKDVAFGATFKGFRSTIVEKADGWALDLGLLVYDKSRDYPFRAALAVQNIGKGLKYDQVRDSLPLTLRTGASLGLLDNLLVSVDLVLPKGASARGHLGVELQQEFMDGGKAALRAGMDSAAVKDQPGVSGFSLGAGLQFGGFGFDYAFVPFGDLGQTHRVSVGFGF